MQQRLRSLVEIESPSDDAEAVSRAGATVAAWAEAAGAEVRRHPGGPHFADVLELRFPASQTDPQNPRRPLLLLGHLDTVWPAGTLAAMPWREAPDAQGRPRLWGPGVLDMKAGVVMALEAIAAVSANFGLRRDVILLLHPDEEVGSPVSRPWTEEIARECEAVLVLEPAQGLPGEAGNAACKTARKGIGNYRLQVRGVASHAGVDFERGHSAVLELARLVQTVSAWTDLSRGLTVNVGTVAGGTRSNVVAAEAAAEVDVRVATAADGAEIDRAMHALRCQDSACTLTVSGSLNRPPMERSAGTVRLYEQARTLAAQIGLQLDEASTGGGSDGNFTAALGVPTLDGLGAVGEGAHAAHESVLAESLVERASLLAALIATL